MNVATSNLALETRERITAGKHESSGSAVAWDAILAQLVARPTGLAPPDAEQRLTQVATAAKLAAEAAVAKARDMAETARKSGAHLALWIFASLLTGAFFVVCAATVGGRQRDGQIHYRSTAQS